MSASQTTGRASKSTRGQLFGWLTSIAFDKVDTVRLGCHSPFPRKRGTRAAMRELAEIGYVSEPHAAIAWRLLRDQLQEGEYGRHRRPDRLNARSYDGTALRRAASCLAG
jgi:hypothetical protein